MQQMFLFSRIKCFRHFKHLMHGLCLTSTLIAGGASAATATAPLLTVSQTPLFLAQPPQPNIMYTLDNSGSMQWGSITGFDGNQEYTDNSGTGTGPGTSATRNTRAYYSSDYNGLAYNPAILYPLPAYYDTNPTTPDLFPASTPTAAPLDPYKTSPSQYGTNVVNLQSTCYGYSAFPTLPMYTYTKSGSYWQISPYQSSKTTTKNKVTTTTAGCVPTNTTSSGYTTPLAQYAFYYVWDRKTAINSATPPDAAFPTRVDIISTNNSYTKVAARTDCTGTTCTYAQEIQNFANWYTYYRTRILMMKSSLGLAFASVDPVLTTAYTPQFRVGFNTINSINGSTVTENNTGATDSASFLTIRAFDSTQKQSFYTKLYAINPANGTPLLEQMDKIGQLYQGTLSGYDYTNNDPYADQNNPKQTVSCRPSFLILSTDGYWNDDNYPTPGSSTASTLAAVASYYYTTDLRPSLTDNVVATTSDGATYQHMTDFTIGLGANGTLAYSSTYTAAQIAAINWPSPIVANGPTTIDDLWHAGVVGHGGYFSASNPTVLQTGLTNVLKSISAQKGAGSAVALSPVASGGFMYQPSFNTSTWSGDLFAFNLKSDGSVGTSAWNGADAATLLPAFGSRNVLTWIQSTTSAAAGSGSGTAFAWKSLPTTQQNQIGSQNVLNYLLGDTSNQLDSTGTNGKTYRYRTNNLGDIINSSPLLVASEDFGYIAISGTVGTNYSTFLTNKTANTKANGATLYVGANDGMLHAFNANTGIEQFAYVPGAVIPNLSALSTTNYTHQYYVDGPVTEGDAYLNNSLSDKSGWNNILLGTTGAGASSVFAIDITAGGGLGSNIGTSNVLWEVTPANTGMADMGLVMGKVQVVKLITGDWAAIFGNGYSSTNNVASLFVVNLKDGSLIKEFKVSGSSTVANGLSAPALLFDGSRNLIAAYAGDLQGNLWKFDLSDSTASNWTTPTVPLAIAKDAALPANLQPIVQQPVLVSNTAASSGYMVIFGTGEFLTAADKQSTNVQTIYGVWDNLSAITTSIGRAQLQAQTLTAVSGGVGSALSTTAVNFSNQSGWYLDLPGSGERVVGALQIVGNTVLLSTTMAPTSDPCLGGGRSEIIASNAITGGAATKAYFTIGGVVQTGLSAITTSGTATNAGLTYTGSGGYGLTTNNINTSTSNYGFSPGTAPVRMWHQLTVTSP